MEKRFETFEEFWPFYVREHSHPLNRALHFVGTSLAMGCTAGALTGQFWLWPAVPVVGYGFAWFGHFFIQRNRPATFKYPLWSLAADFVMWKKILTRQMAAELERALAPTRLNGQNGHAEGHAPA